MSARWATFVLWALVAGSAVAWGLKLFVRPPSAPRELQVADAGRTQHTDWTRVLGADAPATPGRAQPEEAPRADARFQLVGVVAARTRHPAREGVALIAVDGQPPKVFRVGAVVDGATVLKSVRTRAAELGPRDGAVTIALEIPPPAPPATARLSGVPGVPLVAGSPGAPPARLTPPQPPQPRASPAFVSPPSTPLPVPRPSNAAAAFAPTAVATPSQAVPGQMLARPAAEAEEGAQGTGEELR